LVRHRNADAADARHHTQLADAHAQHDERRLREGASPDARRQRERRGHNLLHRLDVVGIVVAAHGEAQHGTVVVWHLIHRAAQGRPRGRVRVARAHHQPTILAEVARPGRVGSRDRKPLGGRQVGRGSGKPAAAFGKAFCQVALHDEFLVADALPMLHDHYGLSADAMSKHIKAWL
jgi:hypothetical protein